MSRRRNRAARGRFIVLDGPDGAGKSTQAQLLLQRLQQSGRRVLLLREPGGTSAGEAIRKLLLEQKQIGLSPLTETFLFQAARAQLVEEVIGPALKKGVWVLCDRFVLSTLVYQGLAGGVKRQTIEALQEAAIGATRPDRYLVLWVPTRTGIERRKHRAADRMESKGLRFLRAVANAYRREALRDRRRYTLIEGIGSIEAVSARIWKQVEGLLK